MKNILLLCFLVYGTAYGQKSLWNTPMAFLGQIPPNDTPRIFARGILSQRDTIDMDRVSFSPDGKEFYYAIGMHWFNPSLSEVRRFVYADGKWKGPEVMLKKYFSPFLSLDGKTLYLSHVDADTTRNYVWQCKKMPDGSWSEPSIFMSQTYPLYMLQPMRDGKIYLASNTPKNGMDICVLKMSGGDTTAESIGPPVNSPGYDGDFFAAPDESYIILSTKEGDVPDSKLQISFHKKDGTWTELVPLGPLINNGVAHRWAAYVSPDGKYLFYSRGEDEKVCHIYWVRFDAMLQQLRQGTAGL